MKKQWLGMTMTLAIALGATSCAYYNTFYKARSYYDKATPGSPYVIDKPDLAVAQNFNKSIDYSKKLIANYPKSKWVDDAYLLWGKALIGKEDPTQTMTMLGAFATRFPKSSLQDQALFYLGVAGRKSRKYAEALSALEEFLKKAPKHDLAPYAYLEQSRVYTGLTRYADAAAAASRVVEKFPKFKGRDLALAMRADALLAAGETEKARADYKTLGSRANSDEERFVDLLKEADCLERARSYDQEMGLLRQAIAHESEPQLAPVAPTTTITNLPPGTPAPPPLPPAYLPSTPSTDRWGRLMVRIGTVNLLSGRQNEALDSYRRVVPAFQQSPLGAEAQYRVGLVYETVADDFEAAREEYSKVARVGGSSPYALQASQRLTNLERLSQVRASTGTDTTTKQVEAGFMRAELYLFQNNRPERALEEYAHLEKEFPGTPWAAKAINAQAWVLRNKLERPAEADSLFWVVVRDYPRTEAQLNARDYLEAAGKTVPDSMIHPPEVPAVVDTGGALTAPPALTDSLGVSRAATRLDSLRTRGFLRAGESPIVPTVPRPPTITGPSTPDSTHARPPIGPTTKPDSTRTSPPVITPRDTTGKSR